MAERCHLCKQNESEHVLITNFIYCTRCFTTIIFFFICQVYDGLPETALEAHVTANVRYDADQKLNPKLCKQLYAASRTTPLPPEDPLADHQRR